MSAIDTHVVVVHIVTTHIIVLRRHHCRRRYCHQDRRVRRYSATFWLIVVCGPCLVRYLLPPPPLFVTLFDDIVLPPWASVLDKANSCQANARQSLTSSCPPPSASIPACIDGLFAFSL
jgi:hypothetical protein